MENSCVASCAEHCPMYLALETLSGKKGLKIMVLGTGECVFYSFKYRTKSELENFSAYEIGDREMVLGDLSEVEKAVEDFAEPGKKTLVISTCVPTLLSLETDRIANKNVAVVSLPDFRNYTEDDIKNILREALGEEI